jgi:formate hydrogenlyase subunit 6/NADH:ubiquinone oxidoreductase subunit I
MGGSFFWENAFVAHATARSGYRDLVERLNRFPQGAPPSDLLYRILALLFSEREAGLVALLPVKPFSLTTAARAWKTTPGDARRILDELAARALLLDAERDGETRWVLPPPMAGFFEFSMMRVREDVDQKTLARLFYEYLNVEEDFVRELFARGDTQLGRAFVNEDAIPDDDVIHVLDWERAGEVARTARHAAVGVCYCRHKMSHVGRACDAPLEICLTFGTTADSLSRHGFARRIDAAEALDLLAEARARGLVQFGENVRESVAFVCNCCGCCCEALLAQKRFGAFRPIHTTGFLPEVDAEKCNGCGACAKACPVEAMVLRPAGDLRVPGRRAASLVEEACLGCGVCVAACRRDALRLVRREERLIPPRDTARRVVRMALERGNLADLVFDDRALASHRILGSLLGAILRLPAVERALAREQVKSVYLERVFEAWERRPGHRA